MHANVCSNDCCGYEYPSLKHVNLVPLDHVFFKECYAKILYRMKGVYKLIKNWYLKCNATY